MSSTLHSPRGLIFARVCLLSFCLLLLLVQMISFFRRCAAPRKAASEKLFIRRYQRSDLDDITNIYLAAFKNDPEQSYRFPYAAQYPEERLKFSRQRYFEYINYADKEIFEIMVVEIAPRTNPESRIVIAFSIWELPKKLIDEKIGTGSSSKTLT